MCYNVPASISAFIIGAVSGIFLVKFGNTKENKIIGVIIIGVSIMQIAEMLIHLDPECKNNLNKIGSILGFLSLAIIQPIFTFSGTYYYTKIHISWIIIWILIFASYLGLIIKDFPKSSDWCTKSSKECTKKKCLDWKWAKNKEGINNILYIVLLAILPIILVFNNKIAWLITISIIYYVFLPIGGYIEQKITKNKNQDQRPGFDSFICFWMPILVVILAYTNTPDKINEIIHKLQGNWM